MPLKAPGNYLQPLDMGIPMMARGLSVEESSHGGKGFTLETLLKISASGKGVGSISVSESLTKVIMRYAVMPQTGKTACQV